MDAEAGRKASAESAPSPCANLSKLQLDAQEGVSDWPCAVLQLVDRGILGGTFRRDRVPLKFKRLQRASSAPKTEHVPIKARRDEYSSRWFSIGKPVKGGLPGEDGLIP